VLSPLLLHKSGTIHGILFQNCGAAEEKTQRPKSVFILGRCKRDRKEEENKTTGFVVRYEVIEMMMIRAC